MIIGYSMNFFSNFSFSTDVAVSHLKGTHAFFFQLYSYVHHFQCYFSLDLYIYTSLRFMLLGSKLNSET